MIVNIIGCGKTGEGWWNTPCDLSIGVNDCFKFGHNPDWLLIIDSPGRFTQDRINTIKATQAKVNYVRNPKWKLKDQKIVSGLRLFMDKLLPQRIYHSKTSTFVAMSMALNAGAKTIILHGVDFNDHKVFRPGNKLQSSEIEQYRKFAIQAEKFGCKLYVSSKESQLSKVLKVC